MSELKPSSGGSGTSDRMARTRGLKKQDTANEEKVCSKGILFQANYVLLTFTFTKVIIVTSGHRTLLASCKGRAEWSFL